MYAIRSYYDTENGIAINSYFVEHPDMMLGAMEYDNRMFGEGSRITSYNVCYTKLLRIESKA